MSEKKYDLFISHASEDKPTLVTSLAEELKNFGVEVWYDEFSLGLGDSLSRSIDKGLANSRYGLVVLSLDFLNKEWPEYELRGLITRENQGEKVILPIWHKISKEQLVKYSPPLADKFALNTNDYDITELSLNIIKVARPDIFKNLQRMAEWREIIAKAEPKISDGSKLKKGPIRHENLPKSLLLRIKIIHLIFQDVYSLSLKESIDNFRRDLHPEEEIKIWENMAATYLEYTRDSKLTSGEKRDVFGKILSISFTPSEKQKEMVEKGDSILEDLLNLYNSVIPSNT